MGPSTHHTKREALATGQDLAADWACTRVTVRRTRLVRWIVRDAHGYHDPDEQIIATYHRPDCADYRP